MCLYYDRSGHDYTDSADLSQAPSCVARTEGTDMRLCRYFGEKERVASTPCSYSQELLLFNNELDPFNPVHNEAAWVRVHGDLDIAAMSRAFRYLTDRHTVLQSHLYIAVSPSFLVSDLSRLMSTLPILISV